MALIQKRASDISGVEAPEGQFVTVIVRQHPKVDQQKRLDALPSELDDLKEVGDLVILEVRNPDTSTRDIHVKYSDFVKLVPDEVIANAPGTRGRQPGWRAGNGN